MRRTAVRAAVLATLAAVATACASAAPSPLDDARRRDEEALAAKSAEVERRGPLPWVVVQDGALAAFGATPAEALAAAPAGAPPVHRFVFRADDRGERLHRLAFLPRDGVVAGRRLLADLGCRIVSVGASPDRRVVVEVRGERHTIDLTRTPALRLSLTPLGGGETTVVRAVLDPDFDGPLVLPPGAARPLATERSEIPGRADVQVALGRPFAGRRAWVSAACAELGASGLAEVVVPAPIERR